MKLEIELVPASCWFSNLRKAMPQENWDRIRRQVYREYGHQCGICGVGGILHCHEIWEYDDENRIQRLKGFVALCPMCHHVKHIGLARILADRGELDYQSVVAHFLEVNECAHEDFITHKTAAFKLWNERSEYYDWTTDLGEYVELVATGDKRR